MSTESIKATLAEITDWLKAHGGENTATMLLIDASRELAAALVVMDKATPPPAPRPPPPAPSSTGFDDMDSDVPF